MLVERCSHSASYTCGLHCQFFKRRSQPWAVSKSNDRAFPSWTVGLGSGGAGSKRSGEELANEPSPKRRESGRLTFFEGSFGPLIVLDEGEAYPSIPRTDSRRGRTSNTHLPVAETRPVSESGIKERNVFKPRDSQLLTIKDINDGSREDPSTRSRTKNRLLETLRNLSRFGRHKNRSRVEHWMSKSLPPSSSLEAVVRSPPTGPLASLAVDPAEHVAAEDPTVPALPKKRTETMTVRERKRYFIDTPTLPMVRAMKKWIADTYALFDASRDADGCWLHPTPPPPRHNGRAAGVIHRGFFWADGSGRHCITVNFGVVALVVHHYLTDEQKEGYITKSWHLSHLCGNWTCCNWKHFTVEAGNINISRNVCFVCPGGCNHSPKCMKDKKKRLLPVAPTRSINQVLENVQEILFGATEN